ncbi:MAG: hypothetical protein K2U26_08830 [Cyclobacteriaceae bacterium]|nr:hypothetical protein [Cyclobacteriaceae bacterium]
MKLGFTRKQFDHEGGKFKICNKLLRSQNAIGLIEFDFGQSNPLYLSHCTLVRESHEIKVYENSKSRNKVLVLVNSLEDWILKAAKNSLVNVEDFGLSKNPSTLHKKMPGRLEAFGRLIEKLVQIQNQDLIYLKNQLKQ